MKRCLAMGMWLALAGVAGAAVQTISKDPYIGAIAVDAATGKVLAEDNADASGYPASVLKLMDLFIVLDKVEQGVVRLEDPVTVTAEASKIGGSQVYLKEKEVFPVDELLYALMIQSANDAATALAIHLAGSKDGFVELMNAKAQELGMRSTVFTTVHGLPPSDGSAPDKTTARDLATLAVALARKPDVFRYTSTPVRWFRNNTFEMRTHNKLLGAVEGVDGFKTGYFKAAGFSTVVTAERNGVRIIAVVLGSTDRKVRDAKAAELLAKGYLAVPRPPAAPPQPVVEAAPPPAASEVAAEEEEEEEEASEEDSGASGSWWKIGVGVVAGIAISFGFLALMNRRRLDPLK